MSARCDITAAYAGLAARVAEIATALVGEPNRRLSSKRQLRFDKATVEQGEQGRSRP